MTTRPIGPPSDEAMTVLRALYEWSEDIATDWDDPALRASVLYRSGRALYLAEDYRGAGLQWRRAREYNRVRINDPDNAEYLAQARNDQASVLDSLSQLYLQTERPHLAVDVEVELLALHEVAANRTAVALALARVGSTMLERTRYAEAETYLTRADRMLEALGSNDPQRARVHVRVLEQLAVIHRHRHRPGEARRSERRSTEVAAAPLASIVGEIHNLKTSATALAEQVTRLAGEATQVAAEVGDQDRPQAVGLAKVPSLVGPWYDLADSVDNLADELTGQISTIAGAAGQAPAKASRPGALEAHPLLTELHELTECLAAAAISRRAPEVLIGLFDRSAQAYRLLGDREQAERLWVRALRLSDELVKRAEDPASAEAARAHSIRIMESRSDLYHAWGRLSSAMDMELELVDEHRAAGDAPGEARALARLGSTMITANRHDTAEIYLTKADTAFHALGELDPAMASVHATTLELLATVYGQQGHPVKATRCHRRAETLRSQQPLD